MENKKARYDLSLVKDLVSSGKVKSTGTAFEGARALGINTLDGMCSVVLSLTNKNFYKSMTTYSDHRIWQDVYHTRLGSGDEVYLKLTVNDNVLIVSFKER